MIAVLPYIAIAALLYVSHSVSVKLASGKIDPFSGIFFWSLGALMASFLVLCGNRVMGQFSVSSSGALYMGLAGFVVASGTVAYLHAFNKGADFSLAVPLVNISVVTGGLIFGYFAFQEQISMERFAGIVLGVVSIFLLTRS